MTTTTNHPPRRDPAADKVRALKHASRTAARVESSQRERDGAIRLAAETGASLREIAEAVGMSHTHVKRTLEKSAVAD